MSQRPLTPLPGLNSLVFCSNESPSRGVDSSHILLDFMHLNRLSMPFISAFNFAHTKTGCPLEPNVGYFFKMSRWRVKTASLSQSRQVNRSLFGAKGDFSLSLLFVPRFNRRYVTQRHLERRRRTVGPTHS